MSSYTYLHTKKANLSSPISIIFRITHASDFKTKALEMRIRYTYTHKHHGLHMAGCLYSGGQCMNARITTHICGCALRTYYTVCSELLGKAFVYQAHDKKPMFYFHFFRVTETYGKLAHTKTTFLVND